MNLLLKTMKNLFIFTIVALISYSGSIAQYVPNQDYLLGYEEHYDQLPNIQQCQEGTLKESEKANILNYINFIRSIHKLKPVQYNLSGDKYAQKSALIQAANATLSHTPDQSFSCYSDDGYYGSVNSNLHLHTSSGSLNPASKESIIGWMIDDHSGNAPDRCGHRRAIINPWVTVISFGRVDGIANVGNTNTSAMALLYMDHVDGNISDMPSEFVAYPFQNYPIELVNKSWYLSFSPFYDMNRWSGNTAIDYTNAQIKVKTDDGTPMNVHSLIYDFEGWGAIHNNIRFMVDNMQNEVKYNVTVEGIIVNGQQKEYNYWFKLTNNVMGQKPATPALSYPIDKATNMAVNLGFSWSVSEFTYQYHFQLAKNPEMTDLVKDEYIISNGSVIKGLANETTYYWRVKAANDIGESEWTEVRSFTTAAPKPEKPTLVLPENESTNQTLTPLMKWAYIHGASTYQLQISKKSNFDSFFIDIDEQSLIDTFFTVPAEKLSANTTYYWRVRSEAGGVTSNWSSAWKFKTKAPDPAPETASLYKPALEGQNIELNTKFEWSAQQYTQYYILQIAKSNDFANTTLTKKVTTNTYELIGNELLEPTTKYYWRVQAIGEGGFSEWSQVFNFTTQEGQSVKYTKPAVNFSVYPNPSSKTITIENQDVLMQKVEIMDIYGIVLVEKSLLNTPSYATTINIENINNGLFLIKITTEKGIIITKSIKI
jgi:uncharacterized protein YkwD